jgi:hypothetical protein
VWLPAQHYAALHYDLEEPLCALSEWKHR